MKKVKKFVLFTTVLSTIVYIFVKYSKPTRGGERYKIHVGVYQVLSEIEKFSQQNDELKEIIENYLNNLEDILQKATRKKWMEKFKHQIRTETHLLFRDENEHDSHNSDIQPSIQYEQLRRRVRQNIQEMCNYFSFELEKIRENFENETDNQIQNVLDLSGEYKKILISDIDQMHLVDGYEIWRHKEAKDLSDLVQKRLFYLQNPIDCKNAKKLLCDINQGCGFGCQLHHIVYCLIVAHATKRTMMLRSKGWIYHRAGWEDIFQPVSETCTEYNNNELENWPGSADTKLILLPEIFIIKPRSSYLPLAVPEELISRIQKLHGDPSVWWISQFAKYLFKFKHDKMKEVIKKNLGWKKPIVGIHIRRTDKSSEALFHNIEEYMTNVEDYYLTLEINDTKVERRVFLATDDPHVIVEIRTKYPQYTIIGDPNVANIADVPTRYTDLSLNGIITDILRLSLSDYLVCTFSSNICRIAYEIMQNFYPDASARFKSLDYIYFFGGQSAHNHKAILSHKRHNKDEISIKPGDIIHIFSNLRNGWSRGKNMRTLKVGLFPTFKVKDQIRTVKLPII